MPAAHRDVGLVPADHHLRAILQRTSVGPAPDDHRRLAPAMTDRAHFPHLVRPGHQRRRTGKEIALKVDAQAIAHHRHPQIINGSGQLPNLCLGQELGLVDEHTGDRTFGKPRLKPGKEVVGFGKGVGIFTDADPARDPTVTGTVVELRGDQIGLHPAFAIVMRRLQKQRRFAGVHGRIVEVEFGHAAS